MNSLILKSINKESKKSQLIFYISHKKEEIKYKSIKIIVFVFLLLIQN